MHSLRMSLGLAGLYLSLGCTSNSWMSSSGGNSSLSTPAPFDVNKYAVNNTVCNPLSGGSLASDPSQGLHASLSYLSASQPRYLQVEDMIANGIQSPQDLFFSEINVPTRIFNQGFPLQSGGLVADNQGNDLVEYFALRFEGQVHLGPNDPAGDYQFALLADDGATLSFSNDGESGYQIAVNDDGTHPTQLACGTGTIAMSSSTNLKMRLDYFQGPRYEIALVPLWRIVNSSSAPETLCGQNGNYTFFDPDHSSNPLTDYMQLLSRGWHPLTSANYSVSDVTGYNPCVSGTLPVISNLQVVNDLELGYFLVSWTTDIAATDQVLVTDTASGAQTLTTSDNMLRTSHSVLVKGVMFANHSYNVQAVSIAADLGKTLSAPVAVTVQ